MSENAIVPVNKNWVNKYDNTDMVMEREAKDVAAAYTQFEEMKAYKLYLETLQLEAKMEGNIRIGNEEVPVSDLVPEVSEFEKVRRTVLAKLNRTQRDDKTGGKEYFKKLMTEFETDSIWELSGKIANYVLDRDRRNKVSVMFGMEGKLDGWNFATQNTKI
jgi:ethanolamine utilization protein EutQ (cupin superfamily)